MILYLTLDDFTRYWIKSDSIVVSLKSCADVKVAHWKHHSACVILYPQYKKNYVSFFNSDKIICFCSRNSSSSRAPQLLSSCKDFRLSISVLLSYKNDTIELLVQTTFRTHAMRIRVHLNSHTYLRHSSRCKCIATQSDFI